MRVVNVLDGMGTSTMASHYGVRYRGTGLLLSLFLPMTTSLARLAKKVRSNCHFSIIIMIMINPFNALIADFLVIGVFVTISTTSTVYMKY